MAKKFSNQVEYNAIGLQEEHLPEECPHLVSDGQAERRVPEASPACEGASLGKRDSLSSPTMSCPGAIRILVIVVALGFGALCYSIGHSRGMQTASRLSPKTPPSSPSLSSMKELPPSLSPSAMPPLSHAAASLEGSAESHLSSYHFLSSPRAEELTKRFQNLYLMKGAAYMLRDSNALLEKDAEWSASCHPMLHGIGNWARQRHNVTRAFEAFVNNEKGNSDAWLLRVCNGAFLHGVCESFIKESDNMASAVAYINEQVCLPLQRAPSAPAGTKLGPSIGWECSHGIGHGILQNLRRKAKKSTLMETVRQSNQGSELRKFLKTSVPAGDFINGMWMEHWADTSYVDHELPREPEKALGICEVVSNTYGDVWACRVYAPTAYLLVRPRAYGGALDWCLVGAKKIYGVATVVDEKAVTSGVKNAERQKDADRLVLECTLGVGTQARKENMLELPAAEAACSIAATARLRQQCWQGAMSYWPLLPGQTCEVVQDAQFRKQCNVRRR